MRPKWSPRCHKARYLNRERRLHLHFIFWGDNEKLGSHSFRYLPAVGPHWRRRSLLSSTCLLFRFFLFFFLFLFCPVSPSLIVLAQWAKPYKMNLYLFRYFYFILFLWFAIRETNHVNVVGQYFLFLLSWVNFKLTILHFFFFFCKSPG